MPLTAHPEGTPGMFVATPQGPVIVDEELDAIMRNTGYVASINGEQGAVELDLTLTSLLQGKLHFPDITLIDGVADNVQVQAAVDAAQTAGGGMVWLHGFDDLVFAHKVIVPTGVHVVGGNEERNLLGTTGVNITTAAGYTDDCLFEFEDNCVGSSVVGFGVHGLGGTATPLVGVYIPSTATNVRVSRMWVGDLSDSAVRIVGGVGHTIEDNILGYNVTGRTLVSRCGVLEVNGTDHWISRNEIAAGPASLTVTDGELHVSYPGTWYRTAVWVRGGTHHFLANVAEFGDVDWYLDGCIHCSFEGDRADYSSAHGVVADGATDNYFSGFRAFGNGAALLSGETPVAHGVIHINGAKRNRWDGFRNWIGGTRPQTAGYAWADFTTGNTAEDENTLTRPSIQKTEVVWDTIYRADPASSVWLNGDNIVKRPPSRHSHGAGWTDETFGDAKARGGTAWMDDFGDVVGNCCSPRMAEQILLPDNVSGSSIAWEPFSGSTAKCAVGYAFWQAMSARAQKIAAPTVATVTVNAAGATAGYCDVGGAVILGPTGIAPVSAGRSYTIGCEVVGESTSHAYTVSFNARWFTEDGLTFTDSGFTAATGGGTTSLSDKVFAYLQGLTCPAARTRVEIVVRIARTGLAAGEVIYLQHGLVALGAHTAWSTP